MESLSLVHHEDFKTRVLEMLDMEMNTGKEIELPACVFYRSDSISTNLNVQI